MIFGRARVDRVFRRSPKAVWRRLSDAVVVIDESEGELVRFNGVGDRVWERLDGEKTVGRLARDLSEEFDAPAAVIERDIAAFLARLKDMELIEEVAP